MRFSTPENCEGGEEEEDPEYNILEDTEDAQDLKEEMRGDRAVQISKKEIQQLMTELVETLDADVAPPIRAQLAPLLPQLQAPLSPPPLISSPNRTSTQDKVRELDIFTCRIRRVFSKVSICMLPSTSLRLTDLCCVDNNCRRGIRGDMTD